MGQRSIGQDMNQSVMLLEKTLQVAQGTGDLRGQAQTLCHLGNTYLLVGEKRRAMELLNQSVELARKVGDLSTEGHALWSMCMIWMSEDIKPQKTLDLARVALRIFEKLGDPTAEGSVAAIAFKL
jgi:hypothetical protein